MPVIRPRERTAIIQSLGAGVVPRIGLHHIQVDRLDEVRALLEDLDRIASGGATIRFVIGRYGSGKSFFLNLARLTAIEKKFVVVQADMTPDRRLHASGGQARALYAELIHNMAVRSKPEGGALSGIVEKWITDLCAGADGDSDASERIRERLAPLRDFVGGYDFATVLVRRFEAFRAGDDALAASAQRWLYGEYATKTEAKADLGVRTIVTDQSVYDFLKLWGRFLKIAGYSGLLVSLDELGVISHRLNNRQAREANYETILGILNDCLQGNVSGIGFLLAGTDAFLDDSRRGVMSCEALATRLAPNEFASAGLKDFSGPVIRLSTLRTEDMYMLLANIRSVFAGGAPTGFLVPDEALPLFLDRCSRELGAEFFRTPRDAAKAFTGFLSILEQNPDRDWKDVLGNVGVTAGENEAEPEPEVDEMTQTGRNVRSPEDELRTIRL